MTQSTGSQSVSPQTLSALLSGSEAQLSEVLEHTPEDALRHLIRDLRRLANRLEAGIPARALQSEQVKAGRATEDEIEDYFDNMPV